MAIDWRSWRFGGRIGAARDRPGLAEAVLDALMVRFGQLSQAIQEALTDMRDTERLRRLHGDAIRAANLEEFQRLREQPGDRAR